MNFNRKQGSNLKRFDMVRCTWISPVQRTGLGRLSGDPPVESRGPEQTPSCILNCSERSLGTAGPTLSPGLSQPFMSKEVISRSGLLLNEACKVSSGLTAGYVLMTA